MLLSFQRPSHLFRKFLFLRGAPRAGLRHRGGPTTIALATGVVANFAISPGRAVGSGRSEYDLDAERAFSWPVVEVEQHDLLPCPQHQTPVDDGDRLRRADQRRPLMGV
jgi:hypothetical protein